MSGWNTKASVAQVEVNERDQLSAQSLAFFPGFFNNRSSSRWITMLRNGCSSIRILDARAWLFCGNPTADETAAKLFMLTKTFN